MASLNNEISSRTKTLFVWVWMVSKVLNIALNTPRNAAKKFWIYCSPRLLPFIGYFSIFLAILSCAFKFNEVLLPDYFHAVRLEVSGQLVCCEEGIDDAAVHCIPVPYVGVSLFDLNWLHQDTLMDEVLTDQEGRFRLSGQRKQLTSMRPYIEVYHQCHVNGPNSFSYIHFRVSNYRLPGAFNHKIVGSNLTVSLGPVFLNSRGFVELKGNYIFYSDLDPSFDRAPFEQRKRICEIVDNLAYFPNSTPKCDYGSVPL